MYPDSACICFFHWQHRRSRIQRKLCFRLCLQDRLEACFVLSSVGESCPVRAKIHHSDFRSLVCSRPSRGKNQLSRPVSSESLSTPHRLWFDHNTHQRHQHCQGWRCKYRWFVAQLCRVQHRSCKLKRQQSLVYSDWKRSWRALN